MPTFRDIVGYRPSQARRLLRRLNNTPNSARPRQSPETLFPGGQIRELWNLPHTPPAHADPTRSLRPESFCGTSLPVYTERSECALSVAERSDPAGESNRLQYPPAPAPPLLTPEPAPTQSHGEIAASPSVALPAKRAATRRRRPKPKPRPVRQRPAIVPVAETGESPADHCEVSLAHHAARCSICRHPDREAIDKSFLHWTRPSVIAYEFNLGSRLAVYRHAHALDLFRRRNLQTQHALGYLVEQAQSVKPTADSIIRAVKALSCFDDSGRYHEPRKEVLITHQVVTLTTPPEPVTSARRACPEAVTSGPSVYPEAGTTGPRVYPEGATSARRLPAHSYSIAPVGTGDSPIHLKLDSNLIDTHDEQNADPTRIGVLSAASRSEGSLRPQPSHRNTRPSANLIDTDDEQNSPLTPMDAVT